ncbi:hypothetical protein MTO96_011111 [Rhipicephalus appendiculatus]
MDGAGGRVRGRRENGGEIPYLLFGRKKNCGGVSNLLARTSHSDVLLVWTAPQKTSVKQRKRFTPFARREEVPEGI